MSILSALETGDNVIFLPLHHVCLRGIHASVSGTLCPCSFWMFYFKGDKGEVNLGGKNWRDGRFESDRVIDYGVKARAHQLSH